MKDFRPRLKGNKLKAFENITKDETRVLGNWRLARTFLP